MAIKESFQKVIDHFKLEELSDEQREYMFITVVFLLQFTVMFYFQKDYNAYY